MANMSYCRFQNTLPDLLDCEENLGDIDRDDMSDEERKSAMHLIKVCNRIAADYCDNYGE